MIFYLILCRSLTYAQRTVRVLERADIRCNIKRTPRNLSNDGCGYCVTFKNYSIDRVLRILGEEDLPPKQVYMKQTDGSYSEVVL